MISKSDLPRFLGVLSSIFFVSFSGHWGPLRASTLNLAPEGKYPDFPVMTGPAPSPVSESTSSPSKSERIPTDSYDGVLKILGSQPGKNSKGRNLELIRFNWPLADLAVSSPFGERFGTMHAGIDLLAKVGTKVLAAARGKVILASWSDLGYGNVIVVDHGQGWMTLYAHNSKLLVPVGKEVEGGEIIAYSGNTGRSTGPHLHFEIRLGPQPRDPLRLLPKLNRQSSSVDQRLSTKRITSEFANSK